MPVYEYSCPKCEIEFERMRPISKVDEPACCPRCGSQAQKLVSSFGSKVGFYVKAPEKDAFRKHTNEARCQNSCHSGDAACNVSINNTMKRHNASTSTTDELVYFHSEGQKIYANLRLPQEGRPCILLSHGLEGSKDGDKWLILASRLADEGYASLRFSYRGCGEWPEKSEGEPEASTLTERIKDYKAGIDYLQQRMVNLNRLGVIGSSFGGMVALAARDHRIKALVTMATPCHFPPLLREETKCIEGKEWVELRPGNWLPLTIYQDAQKYDVCDDVQKMRRPLMIIHGSNDDVVPIKHAHELYTNARQPKKLEIVQGANHSFDTPEHLEQVIAFTLEWVKKHL